MNMHYLALKYVFVLSWFILFSDGVSRLSELPPLPILKPLLFQLFRPVEAKSHDQGVLTST